LMMKIKQSLIAKTIVTLIQASLEIWPWILPRVLRFLIKK
jgi:hypothetical protein